MKPFLLYIDPGTGSMLFTLLLGLIGASFYGIRVMILKLRLREKLNSLTE